MTANKDWSGKTTGDLYWGNPCVGDQLAANKLSSSSSPFDATGWAKANALTTPLLHFTLLVGARKGGGWRKGAGVGDKTWGKDKRLEQERRRNGGGGGGAESERREERERETKTIWDNIH